MSGLLSKDENLERSAPAVGAMVLRMLLAVPDGRASMFDIAQEMRRRKIGIRSLYQALIFLYTAGIVDFEAPYVIATPSH